MTLAIAALAPVFLTILLGFGLSRSGLIGGREWEAADHICYYVLFPAIIIKELAIADLSGLEVGRMAIAMMLGLITMFALLLWQRQRIERLLELDGPQFTSLFQGATRWHTFIALAVLPLVLAPPAQAMALAAVAMAAMIPLLNVVCVAVMARYAAHTPLDLGRIFRAIAVNPFVLACVVGLLIRVIGLPLPQIAVTTLDIIGRASLGVALLTVGAGLRPAALRGAGPPVFAAVGLKLVLMPILMLGWTSLLGVGGLPQAAAVICSAVPTGSGAYILARQMGGDAPLVAAILTAQVIAAAITLPLLVAYLGVTP